MKFIPVMKMIHISYKATFKQIVTHHHMLCKMIGNIICFLMVEYVRPCCRHDIYEYSYWYPMIDRRQLKYKKCCKLTPLSSVFFCFTNCSANALVWDAGILFRSYSWVSLRTVANMIVQVYVKHWIIRDTARVYSEHCRHMSNTIDTSEAICYES
jgi:hypothetical protein